MSAKLIRFRVHFADGTTVDVDAATPTAARISAQGKNDAIVTKVKVVREGEGS